MSKIAKFVELEIYSDRGRLGLCLWRSQDGSGTGYRVFGPKLNNQQTPASTVRLSEGEITRLILELKKAKRFLTGPNR